MRLSISQWRRNSSAANQQPQQQQHGDGVPNTESWRKGASDEDDASSQHNIEQGDMVTIEEFIYSLNRYEADNENVPDNENHLMTVEEFISSCRENGMRRGQQRRAAGAAGANASAPTNSGTVDDQDRFKAVSNQMLENNDNGDEPLLTVEEFIYTSERRDNSQDLLTFGEFLSQSSRRCHNRAGAVPRITNYI
ncbi:hypothetical protein SAMD00019534_060060 [Acytostelium subglobosum LB1]|uniref:hypothetical protein n=1 Tax=Acytostelium subglobosum LB1 TaxID=1410327 RepID=UPI0006448143|nr:hypothetical protein SAMD00019534_060060 [Acytostelium subglobosum LB1]GAM22831.1 hypothetical protein SAMD00019534_060060 [Acytostelium subglobosum LB1]|eukprot:XP_012754058.1 hypothetical protein SAMD00019534_060060 [Acytostelium subglobosum LB1]